MWQMSRLCSRSFGSERVLQREGDGGHSVARNAPALRQRRRQAWRRRDSDELRRMSGMSGMASEETRLAQCLRHSCNIFPSASNALASRCNLHGACADCTLRTSVEHVHAHLRTFSVRLESLAMGRRRSNPDSVEEWMAPNPNRGRPRKHTMSGRMSRSSSFPRRPSRGNFQMLRPITVLESAAEWLRRVLFHVAGKSDVGVAGTGHPDKAKLGFRKGHTCLEPVLVVQNPLRTCAEWGLPRCT